jgi:nucleotide-binding universal stress UspA family protein
MFKKILLPVDLTDKHQPALRIAADLARPSGGEVILLHVIEVIPGLEVEEDQEFYGKLETAARDHLEKLIAALPEGPAGRRGEILYGNRFREVTRFAAEAEADLIVLTARRIDPDNPAAGWGSLSWKLSVLAPCNVLLVK